MSKRFATFWRPALYWVSYEIRPLPRQGAGMRRIGNPSHGLVVMRQFLRRERGHEAGGYRLPESWRSTRPSACRAKRPAVRGKTGSLEGQGQPPKPVRW